jgi:hypothetical protein
MKDSNENNENLIEENKEIENYILEDEINIFGEIEERRRNNKKSIFCSQTQALMKKTIIVFFRHYKTTILILSSPFIICLILILLQLALVTWSTAFIEKQPPVFDIPKIPKCPFPDDCKTIIALVLDKSENEKNREEAEQIMKYVSKKNDLIYGTDIILSEKLKSYEMFAEYLNNNKNKTYFGVIFCYDYLDTEFYSTKINIPCKPQFAQKEQEYKFYTIVYNVTNGPNDFLQMPYEARQKDPRLMKLKIDIDNAYLEIYHNKSNKNKDDFAPKIKVEYSNYPRTEHRYFGETSMVNNFGAPFFFLIPIIFLSLDFFIFFNHIIVMLNFVQIIFLIIIIIIFNYIYIISNICIHIILYNKIIHEVRIIYH